MNPVEYTLLLQRFFAIVCGLAFLAMCAIVAMLDPYENNSYIWAFLLSLEVFLTCLIALLSFWWVFSIKKQLLTIIQVNQLVYQSLISASIVVLLLVLNQVNQFNIISVSIVLFSYLLYQLWIHLT